MRFKVKLFVALALALSAGLLGGPLYELTHNLGVDLAVKNGKATKGATPTPGQRTANRIAGTRPVLVSGEYDEMGGGDYGTATQGRRLRRRR